MDYEQAEKEIARLKADLDRHNYFYHTTDAPQISDEDYDVLFRRLLELEAMFPDLVTPDSPSRRVGGEVLPYLETMPHSQRMYGLENVFSSEEWVAFSQRAKRQLPEVGAAGPNAFVLETWWADPKLDGLAVEIVYENGEFTRALTRGDGQTGEVVSQAMRTVRNLPLHLSGPGPFPRVLEVRGEVVLFKKDFERLNARQEHLGQKIFANARNAAAGSLRQLDTSVTASRGLSFLAYGCGQALFEKDHFAGQLNGELLWQRHSEMIIAFQGYGFHTPQGGRLCRGHVEAEAYYQQLEAGRDNLPFEIDGVVYKLDDLQAQAALGFTARAPRFAVAWKFAARQASTRLNKILVQVGRTGAMTPLAELEPVSVGGVTVSRASLHNEDEIKRLDVREGDLVIVQRAGDVIPQIVGPILAERPLAAIPYEFPRNCPICGSKAHRLPAEVAWRCLNLSCPAVIRRSLDHFVSKAGLDVQGIGPKVIESLLDSGLVKTAADLFCLKVADLSELDRMGETSAGNIVAALAKAKQSAGLARLIAALGIRLVGEQTAQTLASSFADLDALENAGSADLTALPDIGPEVAASILAFFANPANRDLLAQLRELGLWPTREAQKQPVRDTPLSGKRILFTGTLSRPRGEFERLAEDGGALLASSVSKKLDYLVVGENPGSKLDKARALAVNIISEDELLGLLS